MQKSTIIGIIGVIVVMTVIALLTSQKRNESSVITPNNTAEGTPTITQEIYVGQQPTIISSEEPCAGWKSQSDYDEILIKLNFKEGVEKDTSYEAGFAFSSITRTARLARSSEYCTGFKYSELANKGAVQVAVWGYTDSRRRSLADEPVAITFDSEGKPNVQGIIEVTVLD